MMNNADLDRILLAVVPLLVIISVLIWSNNGDSQSCPPIPTTPPHTLRIVRG